MSKFKVGDRVMHGRSAKEYVVTKVPNIWHRLENCDKPFYAYKHDQVTYYRREDEMEDGRFTLLERAKA